MERKTIKTKGETMKIKAMTPLPDFYCVRIMYDDDSSRILPISKIALGLQESQELIKTPGLNPAEKPEVPCTEERTKAESGPGKQSLGAEREHRNLSLQPEECLEHNIQDCCNCPELDCSDNLNPLAEKLRHTATFQARYELVMKQLYEEGCNLRRSEENRAGLKDQTKGLCTEMDRLQGVIRHLEANLKGCQEGFNAETNRLVLLLKNRDAGLSNQYLVETELRKQIAATIKDRLAAERTVAELSDRVFAQNHEIEQL